MSTITAGEIKRQGVGALDPVLKEHEEAIITVRGEGRYVVMTLEAYNRFRETELRQAVREARADYKAGRITDRSVKAHIRRLEHEL